METPGKNTLDAFYLLRCAVLGKTPCADTVGQMDLNAVYSICSAHDVAALAAYALEKTWKAGGAVSERQKKATPSDAESCSAPSEKKFPLSLKSAGSHMCF